MSQIISFYGETTAEDVAQELARQEEQDKVRLSYFAKEAARHRGVSYSGMGSVHPPIERTPAQRLQAAREAVARRQAFNASPRGRFLDALRGLENTGYAYTASNCRNAYNRGFDDERMPIVHADLSFALDQLTTVGGDSAATKYAKAACAALLELAFEPTSQEAA